MITIREAREHDVDVIYAMLRASAVDQGSEEKLCANPANLREDGFGPNPRFRCLLAEEDSAPAGLALYFFVYSTWNSPNNIYLEDLYVAPKFRRRGVGLALMQELSRVGRETGCRTINWHVLPNNEPAIQFYKSIGARGNDEVLLMHLPLA